MDVIAGQPTRPWYRSWAGPLLIVAAAVVGGALAQELWTDTSHPTAPADRPPAVAAPEASQARWKVRTFPAGLPGRLDRKQLAPFRRQRAHVAAAVEAIHDGLFLEPSVRSSILDVYFNKKARRALKRSAFGLPENITGVVTKKRATSIGIQARGADRAVATTTIVLSGRKAAREIKVRYETNLWMERNGRNWKVIAFDVKQVPAR